MLLFTILLWAWAQSPGSAFIIIYTNDRKLGQWEAKRKIQPSCTQLLWIVCRKSGLLHGKKKFSSPAGLNQRIPTFQSWDRMLLPEQPSAPGQFSEPELYSMYVKKILHAFKMVIPKKISCQGIQFLTTLLLFLHSTGSPIRGDLWCSAGEAACRRIYSSSFHCCCSGRLSPAPMGWH